jgi:hypothetical protein
MFKKLSHELPGYIVSAMAIALVPIIIIWNMINSRLMIDGFAYYAFIMIYTSIVFCFGILNRIAYTRYQNSILIEKYMERIVWQIKNERPAIEILDTMKRWAEIDKKFAKFLKNKNVL